MTRSHLAVALALVTVALAGCSTPQRAAPPAKGDGNESIPARRDSQRLALQALPRETAADKAVTLAQAVASKDAAREKAWVELGGAWVKKARESGDPGFYLNVDACADVVLSAHPDSVAALDLRGIVLQNNHEFGEARLLAERILERRPDDPMAWGTLSDALLEMGRYEEAAAAAQSMVDLKPNLPSYSRASHLQWMRGDRASAKATARAAIDAGRDVTRDPEPFAWVLVQAAMIFWHEGDYDGAEAGFDKALERIPNFAPANVGKGRVAMARGAYARAAELFEHAYASSPLAETAWLLGDARSALGDAKGAEEAWARVVAEGKKGDRRTLSLFWSTKGTHGEEAVALATKELSNRADVYTEDALAWALYRTHHIDEARTHITKARHLGTPDARLLYHEGAIRIAGGETEAGRKLVLAAIAQNPALDATLAKDAPVLLAATRGKS